MTTTEKPPTLSVVESAHGFEDILQYHLIRLVEAIGKYHLAEDKAGNPNPKMAMTLVQKLLLGVEERYSDVSRAYIMARLTEQMERYMLLGFASCAGYTREQFTEALMPLIDAVVEYFAPPSSHPIVDGEYTVLLVLPPSWVPLRRLLVELSGDIGKTAIDISSIESRESDVPPDQPYVLVGVDGGRAQSGLTVAAANARASDDDDVSYFTTHELCQLFLVRPNFLSAASGGIFTQSEALALSDKCALGLVRFVATKEGIHLEASDEKNIHGGVGIGKPYYTDVIML